MADKKIDESLFQYVLRVGDNALILGQRLSAWCGHAPALEEDIALANVALDLFGQANMWLSLAGEIEGEGRSADDLAFLRTERSYRNCLLVEQPNGDYGHTLMRQFLFDAWHAPMLNALAHSADARIAAIAQKSLKEATYHLERSKDFVIRLGDGSEESHDHMQRALNALWPFTGELCHADSVESDLLARAIAPNLGAIEEIYKEYTTRVLSEAMLTEPEDAPLRKGGKTGIHSEGLGHLLSDMQYLQRAYPGASW